MGFFFRLNIDSERIIFFFFWARSHIREKRLIALPFASVRLTGSARFPLEEFS
jgi:hypothetical protein